MSKRRKRVVSQNDTFNLLELQLAVMAHCQSLKAVTRLLIEGRKEAAVARLDGAVTSFQATIRGQCAGVTMKCLGCGSEQDVVAWVDDGMCNACGATLNVKEEEE
jgi:hypothetical protein